MGLFARVGIFVWLIVLFFSCSDDSQYTEAGIIDGEVVLQSGTPQRINNDLILEITGIDDSRCPIGEVCSSLGHVNVTFKVYNNETSFQYNMKYCELDKQSTDTIEGTVIEIVDIAPYRYPGDVIKLGDYRVTIDVLE
jgi:hypothetical protein